MKPVIPVIGLPQTSIAWLHPGMYDYTHHQQTEDESMETTKPVPTRNKRPQMPFRTTSDNFAWLRARADRESTSMNDVLEQLLRAERMREPK